jgi:hypothetical protein
MSKHTTTAGLPLAGARGTLGSFWPDTASGREGTEHEANSNGITPHHTSNPYHTRKKAKSYDWGGLRKQSGQKNNYQRLGPSTRDGRGTLTSAWGFSPAAANNLAVTAHGMASDADISTAGGFVLQHPSNPYWHGRNTTPVPPPDVPIATTHEAVAHIWHHDPAVDSVAPVQNKCKKYSDILQQQRLTIDQLAADQSVNIGQPWTVTNYPLHRHTAIDFKTCWRRFFHYRVFNWRPDLLLEHDWIPKCPHCNTRRGVEIKKSLVAPRLIYGETENYLLNAPLRYNAKTVRNVTL